MAKKVVVNHSVESKNDIRDAAIYLLENAGEPVALRFLDEVDFNIDQLVSHPEIGPEIDAKVRGHSSQIRHKVINTFEYLIYYTIDERPDIVEVSVIRVLHAKQDRWTILGDDQ